MRSGVTEARLRRLASELKPAEGNAEAAARLALHHKLDAMAARLHADKQTDWGEMGQRAQNEEDAVYELSNKLGALVADPAATDGEIERVLADLRIAHLKADLALKITSYTGFTTTRATDRPQPA